ncbi:DNA polymerase I [Ammoniphilus oxalaticus]|uniref:DNA polymerase I n=1 Tax=Ammoniphilus oxalaticus TaxID=66863 RepID=A0A419SIF0_9BACL|nr:DNA polymerase I [Ammoniphilus oxalaticus]RKD23791.1 DNA polymerase I [Ammoniphilus oxalaticus]
MNNKKFIILDGNSIAYRAFYALPLLNNASGLHTNAVYGFTTMLLKILEEQKPTHLLVAFDAGKVVFRHEDYQDYKAGRARTPGELSEQFPYIRELLDHFKIKHIEQEGYEADDIIGTLTLQADQEAIPTVIVTGDKDMLQLVSEYVQVALIRRGISEVEWYTPATIKEEYGLAPNQIIDLKGLMGDTSDNIPGVPGVGEKTALKLLHQFDSMERVLDSIDEVSGKRLKENLEKYRDDAVMSKELATIHRSVPIELPIDSLLYTGYESEEVGKIFEKFEFNSLMERVGQEATVEDKSLAEVDFTIVTEENWDDFETMLCDDCCLYVELDGTNVHRAELIGFGLEHDEKVVYIPYQTAKQWTGFQEWLQADNGKVVHDLKQAKVALAWHDLRIEGVALDIMLASYLINPSESKFDLQEVVKRASGQTILSDEEVYGKKAVKNKLDAEQVGAHVAKKVTLIRKSQQALSEQLQEADMSALFHDLEMPLASVLAEMEYTGINVDLQQLKGMGQQLEGQLSDLTNEIHQQAGQQFNINSPKQLGEILFDKLGLPVIKKTKTGYSTNADVLDKLQGQHEIIPQILHYRQLGKLYSTYIEGLIKEIHPQTGRLHTSYNQATTATGRLSSVEPNLQNIPIRLEEGRRIRQSFVPSEDSWVILSADYSQIELRVLAHIAGDENLVEAFLQGADIHTKTAMNVFGVLADDVTSDMRRQAKAVNFGIIYGISDYGLSQNLNITRKEAASFIERYFDVFQGVQEYMKDIVEKAKQDGYVTTLLNRRRYLPEITHRNFNIRSFAERTAMNTPIQGSAADIIKLAMVNMSRALTEKKLRSRMLLQVHDELVFEVPKEELEQMKQLVAETMEQAITLRVPLKVEVSWGDTWYDTK